MIMSFRETFICVTIDVLRNCYVRELRLHEDGLEPFDSRRLSKLANMWKVSALCIWGKWMQFPINVDLQIMYMIISRESDLLIENFIGINFDSLVMMYNIGS